MTQQKLAALASAKARRPDGDVISYVVSLRDDGYSWDKVSYLSGVTKKTAIKYYREIKGWTDRDAEFSKILSLNPGLREWVLKK